MVGADAQQTPGEFDQGVEFFELVPVDPAEWRVLAVDVVVAALGAGHFVAVGDHGCALGEQ